MPAFNAFITSRFVVVQSRTEWQKLFALLGGKLAKISLSQWQFIVRFLLIIYLCFSLARLFWLLLPSPVVPAAKLAFVTASENPKGSDVGTNISSINIAELKSLHLFGKSGAVKQEVAPEIDIQSTETRLNLALMGVVISNYEKMGRAIIGADSKQDVYAIGAALPIGEGIVLAKVMRDRIIINNNGQYEALYLYQNDSKTSKAKAVVAINTPGTSPEMAQWLEDHAEPLEPVQTEAAQAAVIMAEAQQHYKNNTNVNIVAAAYTGSQTPEMLEWLKDHAEPQGDMITESP